MSVEKQVKRAVRRMFFWRLVGDLVSLPRMLFYSVSKFFTNVENAVFAMEIDAARQYYGLTTLDLGRAAGDPDRYRGVRNLFEPPVEGEEEIELDEA